MLAHFSRGRKSVLGVNLGARSELILALIRDPSKGSVVDDFYPSTPLRAEEGDLEPSSEIVSSRARFASPEVRAINFSVLISLYRLRWSGSLCSYSSC